MLPVALSSNLRPRLPTRQSGVDGSAASFGASNGANRAVNAADTGENCYSAIHRSLSSSRAFVVSSNDASPQLLERANSLSSLHSESRLGSTSSHKSAVYVDKTAVITGLPLLTRQASTKSTLAPSVPKNSSPFGNRPESRGIGGADSSSYGRSRGLTPEQSRLQRWAELRDSMTGKMPGHLLNTSTFAQFMPPQQQIVFLQPGQLSLPYVLRQAGEGGIDPASAKYAVARRPATSSSSPSWHRHNDRFSDGGKTSSFLAEFRRLKLVNICAVRMQRWWRSVRARRRFFLYKRRRQEIKQNAFDAWRGSIMADKYCRQILMKRSFRAWKEEVEDTRNMRTVLRKLHDKLLYAQGSIGELSHVLATRMVLSGKGSETEWLPVLDTMIARVVPAGTLAISGTNGGGTNAAVTGGRGGRRGSVTAVIPGAVAASTSPPTNHRRARRGSIGELNASMTGTSSTSGSGVAAASTNAGLRAAASTMRRIRYTHLIPGIATRPSHLRRAFIDMVLAQVYKPQQPGTGVMRDYDVTTFLHNLHKMRSNTEGIRRDPDSDDDDEGGIHGPLHALVHSARRVTEDGGVDNVASPTEPVPDAEELAHERLTMYQLAAGAAEAPVTAASSLHFHDLMSSSVTGADAATQIHRDPSAAILQHAEYRIKRAFFDALKIERAQVAQRQQLAKAKLGKFGQVLLVAMPGSAWQGQLLQTIMTVWHRYAAFRKAKRRRLPLPLFAEDTKPVPAWDAYVAKKAAKMQAVAKAGLLEGRGLQRRMWMKWRWYILHQRQERDDITRAVSLCNKSLLRKVWQGLRIYHFVQKWFKGPAQRAFDGWKAFAQRNRRLRAAGAIVKQRFEERARATAYHRWRMAAKQRDMLQVYTTALLQGVPLSAEPDFSTTGGTGDGRRAQLQLSVRSRYATGGSRSALTAVQACLLWQGDPSSQSVLVSAWKEWSSLVYRRRAWRKALFVYRREYASQLMRSVFTAWRDVRRRRLAREAKMNSAAIYVTLPNLPPSKRVDHATTAASGDPSAHRVSGVDYLSAGSYQTPDDIMPPIDRLWFSSVLSEIADGKHVESPDDIRMLTAALLNPQPHDLDKSALALLTAASGGDAIARRRNSEDEATLQSRRNSNGNIADADSQQQQTMHRTSSAAALLSPARKRRASVSALQQYLYHVQIDRSSRRRTDLHSAIDECDEARVRVLLGSGADPNAQDEAGRTALHCAVSHFSAQYLGIVVVLVECGALLGLHDDEGRTPLDVAINRDVRKLLQRHVDRLQSGRFTDAERQMYRDRRIPAWECVNHRDLWIYLTEVLFAKRKGRSFTWDQRELLELKDAASASHVGLLESSDSGFHSSRTSSSRHSKAVHQPTPRLSSIATAAIERQQQLLALAGTPRTHSTLTADGRSVAATSTSVQAKRLQAAIEFMFENGIRDSESYRRLVAAQAMECKRRKQLAAFSADRGKLLIANAAVRANISAFAVEMARTAAAAAVSAGKGGSDASSSSSSGLCDGSVVDNYRDATARALANARKRELIEAAGYDASDITFIDRMLAEFSRSGLAEMKLIQAKASSGVAVVVQPGDRDSAMLAAVAAQLENPNAPFELPAEMLALAGRQSSKLDVIAVEARPGSRGNSAESQAALLRAALGQQTSNDPAASTAAKTGVVNDLFSAKMLLQAAEGRVRKLIAREVAASASTSTAAVASAASSALPSKSNPSGARKRNSLALPSRLASAAALSTPQSRARGRRSSVNDVLTSMFMVQRLRQAVAEAEGGLDPIRAFFRDRAARPSASLAIRKIAKEAHRAVLQAADPYAALAMGSSDAEVDGVPRLYGWDLIRARLGLGYFKTSDKEYGAAAALSGVRLMVQDDDRPGSGSSKGKASYSLGRTDADDGDQVNADGGRRVTKSDAKAIYAEMQKAATSVFHNKGAYAAFGIDLRDTSSNQRSNNSGSAAGTSATGALRVPTLESRSVTLPGLTNGSRRPSQHQLIETDKPLVVVSSSSPASERQAGVPSAVQALTSTLSAIQGVEAQRRSVIADAPAHPGPKIDGAPVESGTGIAGVGGGGRRMSTALEAADMVHALRSTNAATQKELDGLEGFVDGLQKGRDPAEAAILDSAFRRSSRSQSQSTGETSRSSDTTTARRSEASPDLDIDANIGNSAPPPAMGDSAGTSAPAAEAAVPSLASMLTSSAVQTLNQRVQRDNSGRIKVPSKALQRLVGARTAKLQKVLKAESELSEELAFVKLQVSGTGSDLRNLEDRLREVQTRASNMKERMRVLQSQIDAVESSESAAARGLDAARSNSALNHTTELFTKRDEQVVLVNDAARDVRTAEKAAKETAAALAKGLEANNHAADAVTGSDGATGAGAGATAAGTGSKAVKAAKSAPSSTNNGSKGAASDDPGGGVIALQSAHRRAEALLEKARQRLERATAGQRRMETEILARARGNDAHVSNTLVDTELMGMQRVALERALATMKDDLATIGVKQALLSGQVSEVRRAMPELHRRSVRLEGMVDVLRSAAAGLKAFLNASKGAQEASIGAALLQRERERRVLAEEVRRALDIEDAARQAAAEKARLEAERRAAEEAARRRSELKRSASNARLLAARDAASASLHSIRPSSAGLQPQRNENDGEDGDYLSPRTAMRNFLAQQIENLREIKGILDPHIGDNLIDGYGVDDGFLPNVSTAAAAAAGSMAHRSCLRFGRDLDQLVEDEEEEEVSDVISDGLLATAREASRASRMSTSGDGIADLRGFGSGANSGADSRWQFGAQNRLGSRRASLSGDVLIGSFA